MFMGYVMCVRNYPVRDSSDWLESRIEIWGSKQVDLYIIAIPLYDYKSASSIKSDNLQSNAFAILATFKMVTFLSPLSILPM